MYDSLGLFIWLLEIIKKPDKYCIYFEFIITKAYIICLQQLANLVTEICWDQSMGKESLFSGTQLLIESLNWWIIASHTLAMWLLMHNIISICHLIW